MDIGETLVLISSSFIATPEQLRAIARLVVGAAHRPADEINTNATAADTIVNLSETWELPNFRSSCIFNPWLQNS